MEPVTVGLHRAPTEVRVALSPGVAAMPALPAWPAHPPAGANGSEGWSTTTTNDRELEERGHLPTRQAAVVGAVSRMTLRRGAHAEVDLPGLGRISVDAVARRDALEVDVRAETKQTAATLSGHVGAMELELRDAALPVRSVNVELYPRANVNDGGSRERPPRRDAPSSSVVDREETAEAKARPRRVRFVL